MISLQFRETTERRKDRSCIYEGRFAPLKGGMSHLYQGPFLSSGTRQHPDDITTEEIKTILASNILFQEIGWSELTMTIFNTGDAVLRMPTEHISLKPLFLDFTPSC